MDPISRISRWFNETVQYYADKNTYKIHMEKLMEAVEHNDAELLRNGLEFLVPLRYNNKEEFEKLIDKAIEKDHKEAFAVLYENINDPNYILTSQIFMKPGAGFELEVKSLLYRAIEAGSPNVALMLVNDPDVDIKKSGYHHTCVYGLYQSVQEQNYFPTPLIKAVQNPEMVDVADVLEKRTIELKIQEANKLKEKALKRNL